MPTKEKAKSGSKTAAKSAGQGLMRAVQPSADLAAVIGPGQMPRNRGADSGPATGDD